MFEVEANLWLQGFDAHWLLRAMVLVSELGTHAFYMAAVVLLAFGVAFRPMLGVLLGLVVAGVATGIAKLGFALPRPSEVDARVLDKGESGRALVQEGGADTFWGLPGEDAIAAVRGAGEMDYGFISGHASAAMAFMLGALLFFGIRHRGVWCLAIGWALLMGVSRMYLGRHFLADVLGGWLLGACAAWLAWVFVRAIDTPGYLQRRRAWIAASAGVAVLLMLSAWLPFVRPGNAGELAGVFVCLFLSMCLAVSTGDDAGVARRIARVVFAFAFVYAVDALLSAAWDAGSWTETHPLAFVFPAIGYPLALFGAWWLAQRLRLYRPPAA